MTAGRPHAKRSAELVSKRFPLGRDAIGAPTGGILINGAAYLFLPVISAPVIPVWAAEGRG